MLTKKALLDTDPHRGDFFVVSAVRDANERQLRGSRRDAERYRK
jgi:hypothetical protein